MAFNELDIRNVADIQPDNSAFFDIRHQAKYRI
jgi:hypothetical protein